MLKLAPNTKPANDGTLSRTRFKGANLSITVPRKPTPAEKQRPLREHQEIKLFKRKSKAIINPG